MARTNFNYAPSPREEWENSVGVWEPITDSTMAQTRRAMSQTRTVVGNITPGGGLDIEAKDLPRGTIMLGGDTARRYMQNQAQGRLDARRRGLPSMSFNDAMAHGFQRIKGQAGETKEGEIDPETGKPKMVPTERAMAAQSFLDSPQGQRLNAAPPQTDAARRAGLNSRIDEYNDATRGMFADGDEFDSGYIGNRHKLRGADAEFAGRIEDFGIRRGEDGSYSGGVLDNVPEDVMGRVPKLGEALGRLSDLARNATARGDGRMFRLAQRQYAALERKLRSMGIFLEDYMPQGGGEE